MASVQLRWSDHAFGHASNIICLCSHSIYMCCLLLLLWLRAKTDGMPSIHVHSRFFSFLWPVRIHAIWFCFECLYRFCYLQRYFVAFVFAAAARCNQGYFIFLGNLKQNQYFMRCLPFSPACIHNKHFICFDRISFVIAAHICLPPPPPPSHSQVALACVASLFDWARA